MKVVVPNSEVPTHVGLMKRQVVPEPACTPDWRDDVARLDGRLGVQSFVGHGLLLAGWEEQVCRSKCRRPPVTGSGVKNTSIAEPAW